ncbi:MAG: hypothetical protein KDA90_11115 [Planctomycetaceae bacterium]|nr:hypothetical protein [Planctomycetaceae bacterium]
MQTINFYLRFYQRSAVDFWHHITPMQYGCLLIAVAVVGWLTMRSASRR